MVQCKFPALKLLYAAYTWNSLNVCASVSKYWGFKSVYSTCRIAVASSLVPSPMKLFAVTAELTLDLLGGNARVGLSSNTAYIPVKKVFWFFYCLFNDLKAKKSKDFHVHAMNTCRGNRVIAPLILNLGIRGGEWLVTRTGRFIPGKEPT